MNILVCIKAVPAGTKVEMDPVTNTLVRDGRAAVVNPFDAAALEEAVSLKKTYGGRVTVLSMGIPDTARLLRDCLARGADEAVLLSDRAFAGADTLATSYALSMAVKILPPQDLILCGRMAVDGDTAQIGPELAAWLELPCISDVREIFGIRDGRLEARKGLDGGEARLEAELPAVLTVAKDIRIPSMPSVTGIRFAEQAEIRCLTASDIGADPERCGLAGSPTRVVKAFVPKKEHACVMLKGNAAEQAKQLAELCRR